MAIVGYATTGFLPFRTFSTKTSLSQLVLRDRRSILPTRHLWHWKTRALTQKQEEQSLQEDQTGESMDDEIYDEEWQAQQREKTRQWHAYRKKEEEEEKRKMDEYREIGMRLKEYPEEDVCKARILVSDFISAAEEVEEVYATSLTNCIKRMEVPNSPSCQNIHAPNAPMQNSHR